MAEADPAAGELNAPRDVDTETSAEQQSKVRRTPIPTDRGWWDETAAVVQLPPLPVPPVRPPQSVPPGTPGLQPTLPALSGGRTPADAGTHPPRPIPTLDPRPLTAADLEDEGRPPLLASLRAKGLSALGVRPTSAWLSVGIVAVGIAFVSGLLLGRGKAPAPVSPPVTPHAPTAPASPVQATPAATPPNTANTPSASQPASTTAPPQPATSASVTPESAPSAAPADAVKGTAPKPALEPFNAKAARTNLSVAVARAQRCRDQTAPAGSVSAVVTFVTSGRVADVTVITPTYAGTHTGKCIISKLKTAQVPPYAGPPETMKKTFTLR
jgi:hypothetical protein